jgi:glycogen debranching enzyme
MTDAADLRARAEAVLRKGDRGGYTVPAPTLYPHQWNWDSAFCAIGWAHLDPRRAARELELLLRGQWDDGMIPHIVFDPDAEHYEPGPRAWKTEGAPGAPRSVRTSSITQPPVAATAARFVLERSGGDAAVEASLRRVAAGLERWHAWFAATRDPGDEGLVCLVHPWESGMDNAPRWDAPLARIDPGAIEYRRKDDTVIDSTQRPTRYDYDRYFFLVRERARLRFAPPSPATEPFLVQDAAVTAITCRAEEDLAHVAEALGIATRAGQRRARLAEGMTKLWDEASGTFVDRDLARDELLRTDHAAGLVPLFAGVAPPIAERLIARLQTGSYGAAPWPVPTVPPSDGSFDRRRYWRGPVWINVNWMLVEGLRRAGATQAAAEIASRTLELVTTSGFREYFDPLSGEGLGADDFAWTAALTIDLLAR